MLPLAFLNIVLEAMGIMFDVVPGGPVRGYAEMLGELDARYPDAWGLMYQTDVRTRNEILPRVKANCIARHARAMAKVPLARAALIPNAPGRRPSSRSSPARRSGGCATSGFQA